MNLCFISTGSKCHLFLQSVVVDFVLVHIIPAGIISSFILSHISQADTRGCVALPNSASWNTSSFIFLSKN